MHCGGIARRGRDMRTTVQEPTGYELAAGQKPVRKTAQETGTYNSGEIRHRRDDGREREGRRDAHKPADGLRKTLIRTVKIRDQTPPHGGHRSRAELCCGYRGGLVFEAHRLVYHST